MKLINVKVKKGQQIKYSGKLYSEGQKLEIAENEIAGLKDVVEKATGSGNGPDPKNELKELEKKSKELQKALDKAKDGSPEMDQIESELRKILDEIDRVEAELDK